jgi:hypothetical protein
MLIPDAAHEDGHTLWDLMAQFRIRNDLSAVRGLSCSDPGLSCIFSLCAGGHILATRH